jgi:cytochrome c oxidase subunit 2
MILFAPSPASFDLPPAISTDAAQIDTAYNIIWWFSAVFGIGIYAAAIYFIMKYRRKKGVKSEKTAHYPRLELAWTVLPVFFIIYLFHIGFAAFIKSAVAADDAIEIRVKGQKWLWTFTYPSGRSEPDELYVPVGKNVKFVISSSDVLHSLYIPGARIKKDAVPGMYTTMAFTPNVEGDYPIFCAEYCGAPPGNPEPRKDPRGGFFPLGGHSGMMAVLHVVSMDKYESIANAAPKVPDECKAKATEDEQKACWGEKLYAKNACLSCHSTDGSPRLGPTWKAMYGHPVVTSAGEVTADDAYLKESILKPQAKIVKGFEAAQMPPYTLSDPELDALIAYMKTLK